MEQQAQAVLRSALALPEADRAEIAGSLLDSLDPSPEADVERAWRQEVAARVAALDAGVEAQQTDEIGAVAVEAERMTADLVATGGRIVGRLALVLHVAEQVTLRVLRPRLAEVHPDAPVHPRRILGTEPVDVERSETPG